MTFKSKLQEKINSDNNEFDLIQSYQEISFEPSFQHQVNAINHLKEYNLFYEKSTEIKQIVLYRIVNMVDFNLEQNNIAINRGKSKSITEINDLNHNNFSNCKSEFAFNLKNNNGKTTKIFDEALSNRAITNPIPNVVNFLNFESNKIIKFIIELLGKILRFSKKVILLNNKHFFNFCLKKYRQKGNSNYILDINYLPEEVNDQINFQTEMKKAVKRKHFMLNDNPKDFILFKDFNTESK